MEWGLFVIALVVLGPLARAFARRISRTGVPLDPAEMQALRRELEASEARAHESDRRIGQLEERLDFMEKLLSAPKRTEKLPPGS